MKWSEQTKRALHEWLAPDTWYKQHPAEDSRFSVFVASVWHDLHGLWDEAAARERIANEAKILHQGSDDRAAEVATKRVREGTELLDFLSHLLEAGRFGLLTASSGPGTIEKGIVQSEFDDDSDANTPEA